MCVWGGGGGKYLSFAHYKRLQLNVSNVVGNTVTLSQRVSTKMRQRERARARAHTHAHTRYECAFVRVCVCVCVRERESE